MLEFILSGEKELAHCSSDALRLETEVVVLKKLTLNLFVLVLPLKTDSVFVRARLT